MKERDCVGGSGGWSLGERVWGSVGEGVCGSIGE